MGNQSYQQPGDSQQLIPYISEFVLGSFTWVR